ncbi:hypothetical protein CANINC_001471 [Pichia inconspicua]|uniref:SUN-like protein 1 n=1 Tax=Pichia inconspicua TaxID=52247 RepID=A0A4V4NFZ1_9ASCO|nr:hypothetical protein CANINC_001471 [[Candida] inconspicua]
MRFAWVIAFLIAVVRCNENVSPVIPSSPIKFPSFEEWKREKSGMNLTENVNDTSMNSLDGYKLGEALLRKRGRSKVRSKEEGEGEREEFGEVEEEEGKGEVGKMYEVGKTYKERFNFASFDCAATVIKTNSEAKSANAVLVDNKDSYLLNECKSNNQFVIIELCEDILVDEVVIGNFEFYSSVFKKLRFSVSDRYPVQQWVTIGEFEAINERGNQHFNINNPIIWAKFIKIEILSHYGNEFYCPISTIQVYGKTMMEQFKEEVVPAPIITTNNIESLSFDINLSKAFASCFEFNSTIDEQKECSAGYLKLEEFLQDEGNKLCNIDEEVENIQIPPQDSIYKNIVKRLNALEGNTTLTQRYIEEQWKHISEGLNKLENQYNGQHEIIGRLFAYQQKLFERTIDEISSEMKVIEKNIEFYRYLTIILIGMMIIMILILKDNLMGISLN